MIDKYYIKLYFADLSAAEPGTAIENLKSFVSPERWKKSMNMAGEMDRLRSITCEILLKNALSELDYPVRNAVMPGNRIYSGNIPVKGNIFVPVTGYLLGIAAENNSLYPGEELSYGTGEKGKPYLKGEIYRNFHFNFSHSGNIVLCAVSNGEVGCDVQKLDRDHGRVASRFFAPGEYDVFSSKINEKEREKCFGEIWSCKESFMKLTGLGMSMDTREFDIFDMEDIIFCKPEIWKDYACALAIYDFD